MIKVNEINDPRSCLNKASDNEPIFVLLGRDIAASATIRFWIEERIRTGKNQPNDPQIIEANNLANLIVSYQSASPQS